MPPLAVGVLLGSGALPHGYRFLLRPRAATSHSASLGRRFCAHVQYAPACSGVTPRTGWNSAPSGGLVPVQPTKLGGGAAFVSVTKRAYEPMSTSRSSMK
jgi:hypothetical protein